MSNITTTTAKMNKCDKCKKVKETQECGICDNLICSECARVEFVDCEKGCFTCRAEDADLTLRGMMFYEEELFPTLRQSLLFSKIPTAHHEQIINKFRHNSVKTFKEWVHTIFQEEHHFTTIWGVSPEDGVTLWMGDKIFASAKYEEE